MGFKSHEKKHGNREVVMYDYLERVKDSMGTEPIRNPWDLSIPQCTRMWALKDIKTKMKYEYEKLTGLSYEKMVEVNRRGWRELEPGKFLEKAGML